MFLKKEDNIMNSVEFKELIWKSSYFTLYSSFTEKTFTVYPEILIGPIVELIKLFFCTLTSVMSFKNPQTDNSHFWGRFHMLDISRTEVDITLSVFWKSWIELLSLPLPSIWRLKGRRFFLVPNQPQTGKTIEILLGNLTMLAVMRNTTKD